MNFNYKVQLAILLFYAAITGANIFAGDVEDPTVCFLQVEHAVFEPATHQSVYLLKHVSHGQTANRTVQHPMASFVARSHGALHGRHDDRHTFILLVVIIVLAAAGLLSAAIGFTLWLIARAVGHLVKTGLQTFDKKVIGTKLKFKDVQVDLIRGNVYILDMTVCNPVKDAPYETEYLFHAGEVRIGLHMWNFIKTGMKVADVTELVFKQAVVNYERPALFFRQSNVQDVLDFIKSHKKPRLPVVKLFAGQKAKEDPFLSHQTDAPQAGDAGEKEKMRVSIRKLEIYDVSGAAKVKATRMSLTLPTIRSDDFREECDGSTMQDVVKALVMKIGRTVLEQAVSMQMCCGTVGKPGA